MLEEMLTSNSFWIALAICWLITPIGVIFVGLVFESRLIPLFKQQSWAFLPGDMLLGVFAATGWWLYDAYSAVPGWWQVWRWSIALTVGLMLLSIMYVLDGVTRYSHKALFSPTKLYHDWGLYVGYFATLIALSIPAVIFFTPWSSEFMAVKWFAMGGALSYIICVVADFWRPLPFPRQHVEDYRALWQPKI